MICMSMAFSADGNKVVCSVAASLALINDMMSMQNLVFLMTYLTGIVISCEDKIPYIIIAISLPVLIINTFDIGINHLRSIKLPDLDTKFRIRYKTAELINPGKIRIELSLYTGRKPAFRLGSVKESCFTVSGLAISSASTVFRTSLKKRMYILPEFDLAFSENLALADNRNPDMFCTLINTYNYFLLCFSGRVAELDCKRSIIYNFRFFLFKQNSCFSRRTRHKSLPTHIFYKNFHSFLSGTLESGTSFQSIYS